MGSVSSIDHLGQFDCACEGVGVGEGDSYGRVRVRVRFGVWVWVRVQRGPKYQDAASGRARAARHLAHHFAISDRPSESRVNPPVRSEKW